MKIIIRGIFLLILISSYVYLLYPTPSFPEPPADSIQSRELADTETPYRRAYFTNYSREEIIEHYKAQYDFLPTLRLNYPPEDAQLLIRDQTRSSYLEELVHPLRGSLYINGFVPTQEKDTIIYDGIQFTQKLTVRFVDSNPITRVLIFTASVVLLYLLIGQWKKLAKTIWPRK